MTAENLTIQNLLSKARRQLDAKFNDTNSQLEAEILLAHTLKTDRAYLYTWPNQTLTDEQNLNFSTLLEQRCQGIPIAYLTGKKEFWSLELIVNESTLIPRAETELLIEISLDLLKSLQRPKILDLATGSGAIAIALAKERPDASIIASDVCDKAIAVAKRNIEKHNIQNIEACISNWLDHIHHKEFNLIISNPPYLDSHDPHLFAGDLRFEPKLALDGGIEGLTAIKHICTIAKEHLVESGFLLMEHGYNQRQAVLKLLRDNNYTQLSFFNDLSGIPRAVIAQC